MSNRELIERLTKQAHQFFRSGLAHETKLLVEAITALEAHEWRDIADAPDDITNDPPVWLHEPHTAGGFQFAGFMREDGAWLNNLDFKVQHPTHYRPLPDTPKGGA